MTERESLTQLSAQLLSLELQLMDSAFRRDRVKVASLLAEDFREFGSSGRVWDREAILDLLATEPNFITPIVEEFHTQQLAPDTVLVTYSTVRAETRTLRSSIWGLRGGAWQVLFHQGTRAPAL